MIPQLNGEEVCSEKRCDEMSLEEVHKEIKRLLKLDKSSKDLFILTRQELVHFEDGRREERYFWWINHMPTNIYYQCGPYPTMEMLVNKIVLEFEHGDRLSFLKEVGVP